ncbi:MAG: glycerol-3-phosphate 1-O-acyltransferase PlsY [Brevefilum sp.]
MNIILTFSLACLLAYLFGSIPVGYLVAQSQGLSIREVGSGSTGATNVTRTLGWKWGVLVGVLDFFKGFFPVLLAPRLFSEKWQIFAISILPVIGHIFPVWLNFIGGKGVATIFGVLGAYFGLPIFLAFLLIWFLTVRLVNIMSLINLIVALLIPLAFWLKYHAVIYVIFGLILGTIIWFSHRENIQRMLAGEENRVWSDQ